MREIADAGKLGWQINRRVSASPPALVKPCKGAIKGAPRSVLGPAVAAAIFASAQSASAAEPTQRQNEVGAKPSEGPTLPTITVTGRAASAATERTGSYTTGETAAATRLPLSLQETPQSVTVITRQRMDDQQLNSVQGVLENTVGIAPYQSDSERTS
ncbi:MAG TPA: TonB-dependent receptor plug domain-containing protein, partial [Burkholderiaceae bacterium]|nr:TonB-dependent receptor plug domain-containing protein [Burkholderiaceae bacterium]